MTTQEKLSKKLEEMIEAGPFKSTILSEEIRSLFKQWFEERKEKTKVWKNLIKSIEVMYPFQTYLYFLQELKYKYNILRSSFDFLDERTSKCFLWL